MVDFTSELSFRDITVRTSHVPYSTVQYNVFWDEFPRFPTKKNSMFSFSVSLLLDPKSNVRLILLRSRYPHQADKYYHCTFNISISFLSQHCGNKSNQQLSFFCGKQSILHAAFLANPRFSKQSEILHIQWKDFLAKFSRRKWLEMPLRGSRYHQAEEKIAYESISLFRAVREGHYRWNQQ